MNITINGREVEVPPHIAKWAHRMNEAALRAAVRAHLHNREQALRDEKWVELFRDKPEGYWDPDFRPITAEDLARRQE